MGNNCFICFDKKALDEYDDDMKRISQEICDIYPPTFEDFDIMRKSKFSMIELIEEDKNILL